MKVFVVMKHMYTDSTLMGVAANIEKAKSIARVCNKLKALQWNQFLGYAEAASGSEHGGFYTIHFMEVKE